MMSNARRNNSALVAAALLLVLAGLGLSACSSMGDTLPEKAGGLPANAPARPADALPTPNVYAVRPTREAAPLDADGQKKLESDLTSLRESQKARANPPPPPPPPPPVAKKKAPAKKPPTDAAAAKKPPDDQKQQAN
jgi:outer membrane biosynthesis protein TonB